MRTVSTFCPGCLREVTLIWNAELDGRKAYCPHCGETLMLCRECPRISGKGDLYCDYDSDTETCSMGKAAKRIH